MSSLSVRSNRMYPRNALRISASIILRPALLDNDAPVIMRVVIQQLFSRSASFGMFLRACLAAAYRHLTTVFDCVETQLLSAYSFDTGEPRFARRDLYGTTLIKAQTSP